MKNPFVEDELSRCHLKFETIMFHLYSDTKLMISYPDNGGSRFPLLNLQGNSHKSIRYNLICKNLTISYSLYNESYMYFSYSMI